MRRPRPIPRPQVPPGPLRDLKDLLYELYLQAGAPSLDEITALIAADDDLAGAPGRDTVRRIVGEPVPPPAQADVVAVATVLARSGGWAPEDAVQRVRELWVKSRMDVPAGTPVGELTDPFALEVHRPIVIESAAGAPELPVLPPYLAREHDRRLAEITARVVDGQSAIVSLVGGSSTGKTRACWEAVQGLPAGWRLWHPIFPDRAAAFLSELERVRPRTVVWLNDAQLYLRTAQPAVGEQVAAGLRDLLRAPGRGPVLVLATLWPEHWDLLTVPTAADPYAQARALLAGSLVRVPESFGGTRPGGTRRGGAAGPAACAGRQGSPGRAHRPIPGGSPRPAGALPGRAPAGARTDRRGRRRPPAGSRPRPAARAAGSGGTGVPDRPGMGADAGRLVRGGAGLHRTAMQGRARPADSVEAPARSRPPRRGHRSARADGGAAVPAGRLPGAGGTQATCRCAPAPVTVGGPGRLRGRRRPRRDRGPGRCPWAVPGRGPDAQIRRRGRPFDRRPPARLQGPHHRPPAGRARRGMGRRAPVPR
ncbi:hypothetical protein [Actinomadura madurae]|uniref:hypothetical protein n=1 Tax=Actinomadura madurae TaxID=1993 RepID=UPI0020D210F6|nr:hypothetical protein [Actinomadura madurae]MCQ0008158.1 hypothetical protein [Actinomadura madurae]